MSSILVNPVGVNALQSMRATGAALAETQREISTGLKISSAADNASTWSIAESMKSDRAVLSTISDSLAQANSVLAVATKAVRETIVVMSDIKSSVAQAFQPGADKAKILTNLEQLGKQLATIVSSSTVNGVNLLDTSQNNPVKFVASYTNGAKADSKVSYIEVPLSTLIDQLGGHFGMVEAAQGVNITVPTDFTAMTAADLSASKIADTLTNADKAIADLATYGSILGATQAQINQQSAFIKTMNEALSTGISSLIDADMDEASTRLQALQARQQLAVQSLSIMNKNSKMILKLFH